MRYCFDFDLYYCPYCERWQLNQPQCSHCNHGQMQPVAPEDVGPGMLAAYLPDAIRDGRVRIKENGDCSALAVGSADGTTTRTDATRQGAAATGAVVLAIQPEAARLLLELFTQRSTTDGALPAFHIHPRGDGGSAAVFRHWQGNSELSDRALAAQFEALIRQLLEGGPVVRDQGSVGDRNCSGGTPANGGTAGEADGTTTRTDATGQGAPAIEPGGRDAN